MDILKKVFPYSFGVKGLGNLIVKVLVYIVVGAIAGFAIGLLAAMPIIGMLVYLICGLIDLYVVVGIVLAVLDFLKVLK